MWWNGQVRVHPGSGGTGAVDHRDADGQYGGFSRAPHGRMLRGVGSARAGSPVENRLSARRWPATECLLIDADELGHAALAAGGEAYEAVVQEFGRGSTGEGAIDRRALAARVFGDPVRLAQLNALVHPVVFRREDELIMFLRHGSKRGSAVVEAAIRIETGSYSRFDKLILVTCTRRNSR